LEEPGGFRRPGAMRTRAGQRRVAPVGGRALELARLTDAWTACRAKGRRRSSFNREATPAPERLAREELAARAGSTAQWSRLCAQSQPTRGTRGAGCSGSRAGGCSMLQGSPGLHLPALAQLRGTAPAGAPGAPSADSVGRRWWTSSRCSCSWMTRNSSTRSRCSRSGGHARPGALAWASPHDRGAAPRAPGGWRQGMTVPASSRGRPARSTSLQDRCASSESGAAPGS